MANPLALFSSLSVGLLWSLGSFSRPFLLLISLYIYLTCQANCGMADFTLSFPNRRLPRTRLCTRLLSSCSAPYPHPHPRSKGSRGIIVFQVTAETAANFGVSSRSLTTPTHSSQVVFYFMEPRSSHANLAGFHPPLRWHCRKSSRAHSVSTTCPF